MSVGQPGTPTVYDCNLMQLLVVFREVGVMQTAEHSLGLGLG